MSNETNNSLSVVVYLGGSILVGIFAIFMISKTWTLGSSDDDYTTVCIGSHEYYYASFGTKGFLAVKLDDDGKPIKCTNNE